MHVRSNNQLDDQLADLFSESFGGSRVKYICNKLEKYDICTRLRMSVWKMASCVVVLLFVKLRCPNS